jgi:protoporphyrinogen oxidase
MILVIGAGITGLTCASCLKGNVLVVEAQDAVGGYCRTTKRNGFVWDRAGHFFHFRDASVKSFFQIKIPEERFIRVQKKTVIHLSDDVVIDFPFQKNIHQLPKTDYINCLTDLYEAEKKQNNYNTFKEFIYATTGKTIAELFLVPYNEKLYACDLNELDKDAMGRFFPKSSFEEILLNAQNQNNSSYNTDFAYPIGGAEEFVDVLHQCASENSEIRLNTSVTSIDIEAKEATLSDGSTVKFTALINTSPLDRFCNLIKISTEKANLSANKVAVFNLGFDSKNSHDSHWAYYPGDEVFYRVGSYHNILGSDRASLYVEIGLKSNDDIDEKELLGKVIDDLKRVGMIDSKMKLIDHEFIIMNPAYVHINATAEAFKLETKKYLSEKNIYTAGRYGNWTYCSIEDNMIEARDLSRVLVSSLKEEGQEGQEGQEGLFSFTDIFSE